MKKIFIFFLLIIFLINYSFSDIVVDIYKIGDHSNSKFYLIKNDSLILDSYGFVVCKGAKGEPIAGINHLWEHLFFRNYFNGLSLKKILSGQQYNATTHNDYISFYSVGEKDNLDVFFNIFYNHNFDEDSFEIEKKVVITELITKNLSFPKIFKVYTNDTGGTIDSIKSITYSNMKEFLQNIRETPVKFFLITNTNKNFENKIFKNKKLTKESSFYISMKLKSETELYSIFFKMKKISLLNYISELNTYYSDKLNLLYLVKENYSNEDLFYWDFISYAIKYYWNKELRIQYLDLLDSLDSFVFPQKYEAGFFTLIYPSQDKIMTEKDLNNIKNKLIYYFDNLDFQEFKSIYYLMCNDLFESFSDSWNSAIILSYFIYDDNWKLFDYYFSR